MAFAEPTDGARIVMEGKNPHKVTLNGTVQPGDPLAISSNEYVRADASDATKEPIAIAGEYGLDGDIITAYESAVIDFGSGCTATIGDTLYLSDTAGDYDTSAGTTKYIIGRMTTAQIGHVWAMREVVGDAVEADAIDSVHYAADSLDKEHIGSDVYTIEHYCCHFTSPDNETMGLGRVWSAGTVVRVVYWTASALGAGAGIDVLDGGTDGSGAAVIDSSSDNLNGWDANDLTTPHALSAGDYLRVKFDNFTTTPNDIVVDVQIKVPLGTAT